MKKTIKEDLDPLDERFVANDLIYVGYEPLTPEEIAEVEEDEKIEIEFYKSIDEYIQKHPDSIKAKSS